MIFILYGCTNGVLLTGLERLAAAPAGGAGPAPAAAGGDAAADGE